MIKQLYSIRIQFDDGSVPYYRHGMERNEYSREVKKWEKDYSMKIVGKDENPNTGEKTMLFEAKSKEKRG